MMVVIRAVYQKGKFQPLDAVDLQDKQEVQLQIVSESDRAIAYSTFMTRQLFQGSHYSGQHVCVYC